MERPPRQRSPSQIGLYHSDQRFGGEPSPKPGSQRSVELNRDDLGSSPNQADLALATFLAKILMPAFFARDRPDRASPRKTKKAGEPRATNVTRPG